MRKKRLSAPPLSKRKPVPPVFPGTHGSAPGQSRPSAGYMPVASLLCYWAIPSHMSQYARVERQLLRAGEAVLPKTTDHIQDLYQEGESTHRQRGIKHAGSF